MNIPQPQGPSRVGPVPEDPANNVNFPVAGWPSLAKFVAQNPELEAFPTFSDLAIKSLLYYQAELVYLRKKLHKIEYRDYRSSSNENSSYFRENLEFLFSDRDDALDGAELGRAEEQIPLPEQWILIEQIRATLKNNSAALLQFSQLSEFTEAENWNLKILRQCVREVGEYHMPLTGDGAYTWGDYNEILNEQKSLLNLFWGLVTGIFRDPASEPRLRERDFQEHLIVPRKVERPDRITLWFTHSFVPFYQRLRIYLIPPLRCVFSLLRWPVDLWHKYRPPSLKREDIENQSGPATTIGPATTVGPSSPDRTAGMTYLESGLIREFFTSYYSGTFILRIAIIFTTVAACLFPTLAISVLAFVESKRLVLGLVSAFTALFAMGLFVLQSRTSRENVFLATIAFSAVMVVFVQNQVALH